MLVRRWVPSLLNVAIVLASCGRSEAPPPAAPPPAPAVPAAPPATVIATAELLPEKPKPPEGTPLFVAADGFEHPVTLHPLVGGALVTSFRFVAALEGDAIVPHPAWIGRARTAFEQGSLVIGGRFPDSTWLATREADATVRVFRLRAKGWVEARKAQKNGAAFTDIAAWDGRVIGFREGADQMTLDVLDGPKLDLVDCNCSIVRHGRGAAVEGGIVLVFGHRRAGDVDQVSLQRWDRENMAIDNRIAPKGLARVDPVGAHVRGDAYVLGANLLAKDGSTAPLLLGPGPSTLDVPVDASLIAVAGASDGTICIAGRSKADAAEDAQAWCRPKDGAWTRLLVPEEHATVHQVWPRSASDVWVSATLPAPSPGAPRPSRLYRTVKPAEVLRAPR
jgi:hypothetical protein